MYRDSVVWAIVALRLEAAEFEALLHLGRGWETLSGYWLCVSGGSLSVADSGVSVSGCGPSEVALCYSSI